ncbi:hypothetical protein GOBAR_AA31854 [Gossypium barbadense]|uniref:Reverse transcriptase zinc-binding domain-containing protein n=1 Tax=Gossypium barbadense TaxID=3634 RepID=A0A2P5WCL0_GOSBA|nr:hypothetical protein GOBAR_AA31854 [Gossypium barbadense]
MESLWVKVLRSKYKVTERLPEILSSSSCSYIWRSLRSVWKDIQGNMAWKVVTGREVKFWTDTWFRDLGPLTDYCTVPQPTFPNATVYAVVTPEGDWNCAKGNQITILGSKDWWATVEWENEATRDTFLPSFRYFPK